MLELIIRLMLMFAVFIWGVILAVPLGSAYFGFIDLNYDLRRHLGMITIRAGIWTGIVLTLLWLLPNPYQWIFLTGIICEYIFYALTINFINSYFNKVYQRNVIDKLHG